MKNISLYKGKKNFLCKTFFVQKLYYEKTAGRRHPPAVFS